MRRNTARISYLSVIVLLLMLASTGYAQEKHSLWKIESRSNTVYLLGSMHLLKKEHYPLNGVIEAAFEDAQDVVFEANIDSMSMPGTTMRISRMAMYKPGRTLQQSISKDSYQLARARAEGLGLKMEQLNPFKPWFCALTLVAVKLQKLGFAQQYGIDRHFFAKAKKERKQIRSLESVNDQIDLLTSLSPQNQESLLRQSLKDMEVVEQFFNDMYAAWAKGDAEKLGALLSESFADYPALYDKLLVARNRKWVPQIERFMTHPGNYLVIVGAGHLVGRDSVLDMLKARGYTVRQL